MVNQAFPPLHTALSLVDSLDAAVADLLQPTPSILMQIIDENKGVFIGACSEQGRT